MWPTSAQRVASNTSDEITERIRHQTLTNIVRAVERGPDAIDDRLKDLEREWDIERCLETMAPTISLIGMVLGLTGSRKWLFLPIAVQSFFLQHALQGWCPPLPILRRLGIRTVEEIDEERYALKVLRGDFQDVAKPARSNNDSRTSAVLEAIRG